MRDFTDWYFSFLGKLFAIGFVAFLGLHWLQIPLDPSPFGLSLGTAFTVYLILMFFPRNFFERHPRFQQHTVLAVGFVFALVAIGISYFDQQALPVDDPNIVENLEPKPNLLLIIVLQSILVLVGYLTPVKNHGKWEAKLSKVMVRSSVLGALLMYFFTMASAEGFVKKTVLGQGYEPSGEELFNERLRSFEYKNLEALPDRESARVPASLPTHENEYSYDCEKKKKAFDRMYSETWRDRFLTYKVEAL